MTTLALVVWRSRLARPVAWMAKISSQLRARWSGSAGTNGWRATTRRRGGSNPAAGALDASMTRAVAGAVGGEARVVEPLVAQPVEVDVGDGDLRRELEALGLGQEHAVLGDQEWPPNTTSVVLSPGPLPA